MDLIFNGVIGQKSYHLIVYLRNSINLKHYGYKYGYNEENENKKHINNSLLG